jgi:hypothetical protein
MIKVMKVVTLKAYAKVVAVTGGVVFERLVVIFLKRAPR